MPAQAGFDSKVGTPPPLGLPPTSAVSQPGLVMLKPALLPTSSWQPDELQPYFVLKRLSTAEPESEPEPPHPPATNEARAATQRGRERVTRYMGPPKRSRNTGWV